MAQFDVYRNPRGDRYPLLVDVQADMLETLETRVVVPLIKRDSYAPLPMTRAMPTTSIKGTEYILLTPQLAAVPKAALGKPVASLVALRPQIIAALDLLFIGA